MKKIAKLIEIILIGISVLTLVAVFVMGDLGLDLVLYWAYILLGLSVVITLVLAGANMFNNPGGARRALIGLGAVAVVLLITYFMSNTDPVVMADGKVVDNALSLTVTDMGLYTSYFMLIAAFIVVIAGEIRNSFK